jgi:hypothetical protein
VALHLSVRLPGRSLHTPGDAVADHWKAVWQAA